MTNAIPNFLEGPTYIAVRRYKDGEVWAGETQMGSSLQDAISDLDNLWQVFLLEDGKAIDISVDAAELWWAKNGHSIDSVFEIPEFIHNHIHNQVYDEITASRYEANCDREHERYSIGGRL